MTLSALTAAALVLSASACQSGDGAGDIEEVVIGADLELSGPTADIGQAYQRALDLKISQVNDSGVLGNRRLKLDARDNRSDSSLSLTNVGTFANNPDVAAVIMGTCALCVNNVAKTAQDRRVPTIALAPAGLGEIEQRDWIFKVGPNSIDNAAALTSEITADRKVKRVGLLRTDDPYGKEGEEALTDALSNAGVKVKSVAVRPTDTDVKEAMGTLLGGSRIDAIVVWTLAEQAALAATRAKEVAFKGPLFFDGGPLAISSSRTRAPRTARRWCSRRRWSSTTSSPPRRRRPRASSGSVTTPRSSAVTTATRRSPPTPSRWSRTRCCKAPR
ncbi:hypothetical protein Pflav_078230 [Phytohabitans flavus]|uniref:Leucine-binding protein domain-containing protein n=1 Tax=Phytohabitans flavus TaxID=1076124 RepID=A0A6F8Y5W2_9ACTN|nr:hypothetical protein Pflav_078230 [Phytohabitans flavus]